jgi:hypothetical protein
MATAVIPVDSKKFEATQSELQKMVSSIVVKDADTCLQAKTAQRDIRSEMKLRHAVLDPFVIRAKTNYDDAKMERDKWIAPLETMDETLAAKVKTYEREEREAAQREQDRINAENARIARERADAEAKAAKEKAEAERKAAVAEINRALKAKEITKAKAAKMLREAGAYAEAQAQQAEADAEAAKNVPPPEVTVRPNIPTVSGVPSRRNWKFRVVDENALMDAFRENMSLRLFVQANEIEIGRMVRDTKDKAKAEAKCPGIVVFEE